MIHFITGGTRSGKSSYCEELLEGRGEILYIATAIITDKEMEDRVKQHQKRRGQRFRTYEGSLELHKVVQQATEDVVMLECMGTWITNMIFEKYDNVESISRTEIMVLEESIMQRLDQLLEALAEKEAYIISNEVGMGLVSEYKLGRIFTDILGRVNQKLAKKADKVTFMVSGLPMKLK